MAGTPRREYRRRWQQNLTARRRAWREANPGFVGAWFEAADKDEFYTRWLAAFPLKTERPRQRGDTETRPALARLTLPGREPFYGMSGTGFSLGAALYPDGLPGVTRISLAHAEGDALAQAVNAGHRGSEGTLTVDHDPCTWCVASYAGYARLLKLGKLTVRAPGGLVGTWYESDGKFYAAGSHWWAGFGLRLDRETTRLIRAQARSGLPGVNGAYVPHPVMSRTDLIGHLDAAHGGGYTTTKTLMGDLTSYHDWLHSGRNLTDEAQALAATHTHDQTIHWDGHARPVSAATR